MKPIPSASAFAAVALVISQVVARSTPADPSRFTLDDEMKMRAIVDARVDPDGGHVAYVVSTPSVAKNEHEAALYVVPSSGGAPTPIGTTMHIVNTPVPRPQIRWTPDGGSVSVLAVAGTHPQVLTVPRTGGTPHPITDAPEGVAAYEWSPDGKNIAYLTRDPMPADEARQRQDQSFVIHADAPDRPARLVVLSVAGGSPRVITPPSHYVDSLSWSPDSRGIVYSAAPRSGFTAQYAARIYTVALDGGPPRVLVDRPGINIWPQYSPDGRSIAFITTSGRAEIMAPRSLAIVSAAGGNSRTLLLDDAWVNEFVWARDSKSIYLEANDGTFGRGEHMFEQNIVRVMVADGRAERIDSGQTVTYSLSLSQDGRRLAYRSIDGRSMGDLFVSDPMGGKPTRITEVNPELRERALGDLTAINWRSFDGMEIWGLLLTPPGIHVKPGTGYAGPPLPVLVYCHGGPNGGVTYGLFPQFMHTVGQVDPYPTEALAGAGYAILFPMPRGGAGYGEAGQRAIVNQWGEADYRDIMAGVDDLIRRGIADRDRLGVMGASYGGYMTNWIVTQTARFKAASAGASISDLTDLYYLSEASEFIVEYFQRPWENRDSYVAHSPLTFANRVATPLLIQHGERDPRVPISGAWKFYRALKALGKTVELDIYPRGGHVLYEPALQREQMRRNFEWFAKWIPTAVRN